MIITSQILQKLVQGNTLNLSRKELTCDDIGLICSFLNGNLQINSLNLCENQIRAIGAKALAEYTSLTFLDVSFNQIGAEGAKALAKNKILTSLDVNGNQIGDEGAKTLAANRIVTGKGCYGPIKNQTLTQNHASNHAKAEESSCSTTSISMVVLGGFIAAIGIAAIAIAFTALNANANESFSNSEFAA